MREYGFSLSRTLPYKDRIVDSVDSVLIRENTVGKNLCSRIIYAVMAYLNYAKYRNLHGKKLEVESTSSNEKTANKFPLIF